jgi:hypothetical protein
LGDDTIKQYRDKLISELAYLAARESQLSADDFTAALRKAACVFPGATEGLKRFLSENLHCSRPTVQRWLDGHSRPAAGVRSVVLVRLRKKLIESQSG